LVRDILHNHGGKIAGQKILLIGAGGAARGVLQPLLAEAPAQLQIVNRTASRAQELAVDFKQLGEISGGGFDNLARQNFDLIINATAASLQGKVPPLPDECCTESTWCYDMMYGAQPTPFMKWAEQRGAKKSMDGLGMLVEQAAESFLHWRGARPETGQVIQAIRAELLAINSTTMD